jgi:two-component system, response regulator YesN
MKKQTISNPLHRARILVVDDYPDMAASLGNAISRTTPGVEIITATSSELALKKIGDHAVDMLITDMMMPGINGLALVEKLHFHPGGRPAYIILITAYDVSGLKESAMRLKVDEIVIKPFPPERICHLVENALDKLSSSKVPEQLQ